VVLSPHNDLSSWPVTSPSDLPRDLPADLELVRTTEVFDNDSVPAGLLRAHQVAEGVWGRLVVHTGRVRFVFEDLPERPIELGTGQDQVIPPLRLHHLELDEPATFAVEFYRRPS
jgi:tellurite resistance-related uncharacterized protein